MCLRPCITKTNKNKCYFFLLKISLLGSITSSCMIAASTAERPVLVYRAPSAEPVEGSTNWGDWQVIDKCIAKLYRSSETQALIYSLWWSRRDMLASHTVLRRNQRGHLTPSTHHNHILRAFIIPQPFYPTSNSKPEGLGKHSKLNKAHHRAPNARVSGRGNIKQKVFQ